MRSTTELFAVALVCACEAEEGPPPVERDVVDPHAWAQVDAADDAFAYLRPSDVTCDPVEGFGPDWLGSEPSFEINTGRCNYLTIAQPLLEDVRAGDPMKLRLWHFELFSPEGEAVAWVGVALDGEPAWETSIPIPGPGALVVGEWQSPVDAEAGTPIQFHVHNHGINSWDLLTISVTN